MASWSQAAADPINLLETMTSYLITDVDLYLDWHQMHIGCERVWVDVTTHIYNETGERPRIAPLAVAEILKEASNVEQLARSRGVDPAGLLRTDAHMLNRAWKSIQSLCAGGLGDACITGIVERTRKDACHPNMWVADQLDELYENWVEERKKSPTLSVSCGIADNARRDTGRGPLRAKTPVMEIPSGGGQSVCKK
ncbi:hypothetical protein PG994_002150 [Apiospora phragmitis]|uniref:Uncharacterized protein n=1 Tax=Apiospora phragmitis TaxID=2905665 RepID=A0ABR1WVK2_9PEZI